MIELQAEHDRAAALRRAFDQTFAVPPPRQGEETEDLLAIRIAGDPCAIRLREIDGVATDRRIVPVPGRSPDCLGVAGIRGTPVPVFDLALLLGFPAGGESARWLVLSGREDLIALAFGAFEGFLRLPTSSFQSAATTQAQQRRAGIAIRTEDGVRAVVSIAEIVRSIRSRGGRTRPGREQ